MKKIISVLLLLSLLFLSGCGAKETKSALSCEEIAKKVQESAAFQELTPMTDKYIAKHLFIDGEMLSDQCMLRDATAATPEFILVVEVKEEKNVKEIRQAVQEYLDEMLPQYRDYQPAEMPKLESAQVTVKGKKIALIVSPDAKKTSSALESAW